MSLSTRWEQMFAPKPSAEKAKQAQTLQQAKTMQSSTSQDVKAGQTQPKMPTQQVDIKNLKPITINTNVFDDLQISPLNGAIINASLKEYNISLDDKNPMPLLSSKDGEKYTAQNILLINGKPVDVIFSHQSTTKKDGKITVVMAAHTNGLDISRQYVFDENTYAITVTQSVKNTTDQAVNVTFDNEITREVSPESHSFSLFDAHSYSFKGVGLSSSQKPFQKESFNDLADTKIPTEVTTTKGWAAMIQHYFVSLWVPDNPDTTFKVYAQKLTSDVYQAGVQTLPVVLNKGQVTTNKNILYAGPTITKNLEAMVSDFGQNKPEGLDKLVDYGLLSFISVIIFWLMGIIHGLVGNWGVAIILVTVIIKLLFYPLSAKSYKSMAKMRMLQPRMKKLQELYKGDRQKLGRKMMEMYKEEKVNPASGCLPILIQIPVFIALYWVLLESVQLRQAPFIFWIHDLASKDPYFILPILMGISMFVQQKISPSSADPTQAKIMMLMPVIFTVFFASFPSGLVLYWLTNNVISILQQWYITKKYTAIYKAKRA